MNRSTVVRRGLAAVCVAVTATAVVASRPADRVDAQAAPRPNVLLIVTDDQRDFASTLAVMPKVKRWLVDTGKNYPNAMVTTPSCCPSRSSIFTGRYVHNHGVRGQNLHLKLDQSTTLQANLKRAGYRTGMVGKYLNDWPLATAPPHFDRYAMVRGGYVNEPWNINGTVATLPDYTTTRIGTETIASLNSFDAANDAQPWFMYVATLAPHKPMIPEAKYATAPVPATPSNPAINEDVSDKPWYLAGPPLTAAAIASYRDNQLRTLKSVDDMVDRVLTRLQQLGELDNTLVIFTSDNGVQWGEQRRLSKFVPYRPSIRVPLVMRWTGHISAAVASARMAANIDLAPTIFAAAGLPAASWFDGRSLIGSVPARSRLLLEYFYDTANGTTSPPTWSATVTPTYQYIESYKIDGTRIREYYDLVKDPWMTTNVLGTASTADDPPAATLAAIQRQLWADSKCAGVVSCP